MCERTGEGTRREPRSSEILERRIDAADRETSLFLPYSRFHILRVQKGDLIGLGGIRWTPCFTAFSDVKSTSLTP